MLSILKCQVFLCKKIMVSLISAQSPCCTSTNDPVPTAKFQTEGCQCLDLGCNLSCMSHGTCILGIPKIQREIFILNEKQAKQPPKLQATFDMSIHFTISLQAFSPNHKPLPWKTRSAAEGRATPPLWGLVLLLVLSALQDGRGRGALAPTEPPPWVPGLLPTVTATSRGIRTNTACATQNHSQKAKSNYLIALICALVRSTEHNYILALKRVKKKKALF